MNGCCTRKRWLFGDDDAFDYGPIDADERYDDFGTIERDAQDRYFDDDDDNNNNNNNNDAADVVG
jgi:hypothetical protein